MTQVIAETSVTNGSVRRDVPDREAIRREWHGMREAFYDLLDEVPEDAWKRKGGGTAWTVQALFGHLTHEMEIVPEMVEHAIDGKDFLNMPSLIGPAINYLYVRWTTRNETPASVAEKYDVHFEEALAVLDRVQDDEWDKGAEFFGEGRWTVEFIFRNVPRHFEEHAAQIRAALD